MNDDGSFMVLERRNRKQLLEQILQKYIIKAEINTDGSFMVFERRDRQQSLKLSRI